MLRGNFTLVIRVGLLCRFAESKPREEEAGKPSSVVQTLVSSTLSLRDLSHPDLPQTTLTGFGLFTARRAVSAGIGATQ
jgi:hypothetical protein